MSADPIPAIREEDAEGETAAIFADLRSTIGIPFVNLIWRHFATIPGGLAAIWALLRPVYVGGALVREADSLGRSVALPAGLALPAQAWDAAGIGAADRAEIARLILDYNRANTTNFLALLAARAILRGEAQGAGRSGEDAASARPHPPAANARPLPALSDLSPAVGALVRDLDGFGRTAPSAALASLYRHLAHWPAFLAMAYARLERHHRDGTLRTEQERLTARGRAAAATLANEAAAAAPTLDPDARDRVLSALDEFTGLMIGRMAVMGTAMLALLPAE